MSISLNSFPDAKAVVISLSRDEGKGITLKLSRALGLTIFCSLLALILLVAIPYGSVEPWWESLFECAVFALAAMWIVEGMLSRKWLVREHRIFLPILVLILYAFVQTLPILPENSATTNLKLWSAISADPYETRLSVLKLLALALAGVLLIRYTDSRRRTRALLFTLIAVGFASALFGILRQTMQHGQGFLLPSLSPNSGYAQFINRNHFAYLAEMTLGLTLGLIIYRGVRREHALIYLALGIPIWTALVLCNSRGGIFSMLAQILFLALLFSFGGAKRERRTEESEERGRFWPISHAALFRPLIILCLIATVFIGAVWIGGEALTSRLETVSSEIAAERSAGDEGVGRRDIWRATWKMIKDHPLAGVGFNGYWASIPQYHDASGESTPQQAHNDYLELMASGGIIGVLLVAWFLVLLIKAIRLSFREGDATSRAVSLAAVAGLFGVAIHSLVDFGLHVTVNALVFTALVAIAVSGSRERINEKQNIGVRNSE